MTAMNCRALSASVFLLTTLCIAPSALAGKSAREVSIPLPAAGDLKVPVVVARTAPNAHAPRVLVLHQFRPDFRQQEVLALGATHSADGQLWYRLSLPMRPNNTTGWVSARQVELHHVSNRILINIASRKLQVLNGNHVLYTTTVAVGAPGMETPVGHFYVAARFVPYQEPFLGVFAVETSAYSKLTEWPGGGVVGIHGTSAPQLLGQAVSHGCVRVSNQTAEAMKKLAPLGTPITVTA
jgi:lipoprotein-anchoring transpeptidase ErfK/SrfK